MLEPSEIIKKGGLTQTEQCATSPVVAVTHPTGDLVPSGMGFERRRTGQHESIGDMKVTYEVLKQFVTGEPQLVTIIGTQGASVKQYGVGTLTSIDYCIFHSSGKRVYSFEEISGQRNKQE